MPTNCLNCDTELVESFRFCPTCAQKTNLHRLNMHDVLHDAFHFFTHADKGFLQLLKALVTKTGNVAREYLAGKRKKYFPPLNFFLIVAGLLVIIHSVLPERTTPLPSRKNTTSVAQRAPTPEESARYKAMGIRYGKSTKFMGKYANIIAMLAAPLFAFFCRLFYLKGKYNYTEHLVAGLYMIGFTNLVYGFIFIPLGSLLNIGRNYYFIAALMLYQIVYIAIFYYRFMHHGTTASAWKAAGVATFAIVFWSALVSALISAYITSGFWGLFA
jgi:hypothetical protein